MLSIALSVSSCAMMTDYITVSPPTELLTRCEPPELVRVETAREAAHRILSLRQAWAVCNTQHDALVNWIIGS